MNHTDRSLKRESDNTEDDGSPFDRLKELQADISDSSSKKTNEFTPKYHGTRRVQIPKQYLFLDNVKGISISFPINWKYILSMPFIYGMLVPASIWHIFIEIYHQICFRLYGIPRVNPKEYFLYDRQLLSWLNKWEKINCIYCSYINNLIRYSAEIGGRTERYWCPIKYYRRVKNAHSQYAKFVGAQNPKVFRKQWKELRDFSDMS